MKKVLQSNYNDFEDEIDVLINDFESAGNSIKDSRNKLKLFELSNGKVINVKSFKVPNLLNKIVYKFFRKGKAQRSFEYANKLLSLGVGTPNPVAYYEFSSLLFFKKSFYISEQLEYDITYRELTTDFHYPEYDNILRAFVRFTHKLHENNILFLDHSPGNTLIRKNGINYYFYLVDLNRMKFQNLDFETRIRNFSRLTIHKSMIETMSDEYSKCTGGDYDKVFNLMWKETEAFQEKFHRKKRIKKKLLFWKRS